MRLASIFLSAVLTASMAAKADTYLSETFSNYIPSSFTLINADGGEARSDVYKNVGTDLSAAWTACQLSNGYGRSAFALTRTSSNMPVERWMILPSVHVHDTEAVIRWDARSMHKHIAEAYEVKARIAGGEWNSIFACEAEEHQFAHRCLSLAKFVDQDIEIAFVATTNQGFILAVDNIFVGVPDDNKFTFDNKSLHYVGAEQENEISGALTFLGNKSNWSKLVLKGFDDEQEIPLPVLISGECVEVNFNIVPEIGVRYDYEIIAVDTAGSETLIAKDFVECSYFPRLHVIDRCSGTWCSNCPIMELTTTRLEQIYDSQLIVIEAHVNDHITNSDYWTQYLSNGVYAIPSLIPNHQIGDIVNRELASTDDFSSSLGHGAFAMVESSAWLDEMGCAQITSLVKSGVHIDNSADKYRLAYLLIGNLHDPECGFYRQELSAMSFKYEQFYYQPNKIIPEMMYFDNVPLNASVAYTGVPASLPASMAPAEEYTHAFSLTIPNDFECTDLRVLSMIVDSETGAIINADVADVIDPSGIETVAADSRAGNTEYFDLHGRRMASPSGLCIEKAGNRARVILK